MEQPHGLLQGIIQQTVQQAVQEAVQPAVQQAVQQAVQEAVQPAVQQAVQQAVDPLHARFDTLENMILQNRRNAQHRLMNSQVGLQCNFCMCLSFSCFPVVRAWFASMKVRRNYG